MSGKIVEVQWEGTTYYQSGSSEEAYADILTTSGSQATHGDYRHGMFIVQHRKLAAEYHQRPEAQHGVPVRHRGGAVLVAGRLS